MSLFSRLRRLPRPGPGRTLGIAFLATILVPALFLSIFGVTTLRRERDLATQQLRARLDDSAELAARAIEAEIRDWRTALESPAELGRKLQADALVVVISEKGQLIAPPGRLLFASYPVRTAAPDDVQPNPALARAERLELNDRNYPEAIQAYRRLLSGPRPPRAAALQRLARTLQRAGRTREALEAYQELGRMSGAFIGELPADLVGRYEACLLESGGCAVDLYQDLLSGRWLIERPRYEFYSSELAALAERRPENAARLGTLRAQEAKLRRVTEAALAALANPPGGPQWRENCLVLSRAPGAVLVLGPETLAASFWPAALDTARRNELRVEIQDSAGRLLHGARLPEGLASRPVIAPGTDWSIRTAPADPAALNAGVARRQRIYMGLVALTAALVLFGGYFTLRAMRRELEVLRLKHEFVAAVSHEFRSPLTSIRQLSELLLRDRVPREERRREYYGLINRESVRLSRMVENLLDFARMEDGRKQYRFENLDASEWLRALASELEGQISQRGYVLESRIPEALPVLRADREALSCAVVNLLDNAVKYSPHSKTVWLEAEWDNGGVLVRVRDRGWGIDPQDLPHIFDKFYRGRGDVAAETRGAGLGLSLVRHIVEAHAGRVEVDSRPGEGSVFTLRLEGGKR